MILSFYPPQSFVPTLRQNFKTTSLINSHMILEPLIPLIVDRSAEPDRYWPVMLGALIQGALVDYLMKIAVLALPDQEHALYRVIQSSKRELSAKDAKHPRSDVFTTLERLK
ncbi:hypothetical protein FRB96_008020, partial [Tulasnella sp. 330]